MLVLYDTGGQYGSLGELYAVQAGNLASHFGAWQSMPVTKYTPGTAQKYQLTIYIGSTYDEPLPEAFLADVATGVSVLWLGGNVWQLIRKYPKSVFRQRRSTMPCHGIRYRGVELTRNAGAGGLVRCGALPGV